MAKKWWEIPGYFNYIEPYEILVNKLPEGSKFIELGCFLGKSSNYFASRLKELNKKIEFHVVDTFQGTAGEHDNIKNIWEQFSENCADYIKDDTIIVHRGRTDEVVKRFEDNYFDAIMVDADHTYDAVCDDISDWSKKLKQDGLMMGDDYYMNSVSQAVRDTIPKVFGDGDIFLTRGLESTWYYDRAKNPEKWLKKVPPAQ